MGVMGAAVATVLAQLLSVIFCFVVILKNFKIIRLKKDDFKFSSSLKKSGVIINGYKNSSSSTMIGISVGKPLFSFICKISPIQTVFYTMPRQV